MLEGIIPQLLLNDLPPLDAGASPAASSDGLPPLDAGSKPASKPAEPPAPATPPPAPIPDNEPPDDDIPPDDEQNTDEPAPVEDEPTEEVGNDAIFQSLLQEAGLADVPPQQQPGVPPGVSPAQWAMFLNWQNQQSQPQQQQPDAGQQQPPTQPGTLYEISDDDYNDAFESREGFGKVIGKIHDSMRQNMETQLQQQATQHQQSLAELYVDVMNRAEQMVYINDALRDNPDITAYGKQLQIALNIAREQNPDDLYGQVQDAVAMLKKDLVRYEKVKNTKKVDVRHKQTPPKQAGASSRGLHAGSKTAAVPGGLDFLAAVNGR